METISIPIEGYSLITWITTEMNGSNNTKRLNQYSAAYYFAVLRAYSFFHDKEVFSKETQELANQLEARLREYRRPDGSKIF